MKEGGNFEKLFRMKPFTSRLISVMIDEAHCVKLWGSFWKQYQELGRLRHILPDSVHFAIISATLSATILPDVLSLLDSGISRDKLHTIQLSNDRSNIALLVRKMKYAANDLDFLVHDAISDSPADANTSGDSRPLRHHEKFVIFFDDKTRLLLPHNTFDHGYPSTNDIGSSGSCRICQRGRYLGSRRWEDMGDLFHRFVWYGGCMRSSERI